jgi:GalNAc-alpha-(1->4)-GalNAc-alpha-(1->3)-diNAcBac-PP-undecaprenol alpha-1,4-N-acetyl-D-galactosaminyltransferase
MSKIFVSNEGNPLTMVLLISSLGGGGAEKMMASLANSYSARGVHVTLVTLDDQKKKPDVYKLSDKVDRLSIFVPFSQNTFSKLHAKAKKYFHLRRLLRFKSPDVVLSFMTPTNLLAIAAIQALKIRCVVSERTNPAYYSYGSIYNLLRSLLYRRANCVVVQTPQIAQWLKMNVAGEISIVPNFVSSAITASSALKVKHICSVGRLDQAKGFDLLISAFAKLAEDFPDWTLLIFGEGPERDVLEKLIDLMSLQHRVQLCGFIDQPSNMMRNASIVVQPSRLEGFPNALLEAMACGCPVIATHEAGNMLINDGVNGLLIPSDDVDELAKTLKGLMENPQLRSDLAEAALGVRETFSEERVMKLWDKVLFPSISIEKLFRDEYESNLPS